MPSTGSTIVVESVAFALPEPPPETPTLLTCGVDALVLTLTVTMMLG